LLIAFIGPPDNSEYKRLCCDIRHRYFKRQHDTAKRSKTVDLITVLTGVVQHIYKKPGTGKRDDEIAGLCQLAELADDVF
jgi:hypothetical protein